jgi:cytosine/adenosine deaminase-related metal-dependent hydrolase
MNAANEVLQNGYVWIRNGVIEAVASDRATLEANASDGEALRAAPEVEVRGTIYPGMIDLHNHPEYAIYPLLPITRKYKDRYEWRFYDDDYARRITHLNTIITGAAYLDMGLDVGRYGEVKALVGGTTSLQGARAALAYAKTECLVRNIETTPVGTRRAFSRVDIGRDAAEWQRMAEERDQGVLVVHLAEGVGPRMAAEYDALKRSGLVGPQLIAIHGIALTATQLQDLAAAGGKLVWSPLSNYLLYGETANMRAAKAAGVPISLAPDWTPSGSKSILGELKVADLANRYSLDGLFSDRDLVAMVTRNPAAAMGWQGKLGTIAPGHFADIVVTDSVVDDAYRNLITATEANIKLVVVRGEALYGDRVLMTVFRSPRAMESLAPIGERRKVVAAQCPGSGLPDWSLEESAARLQQALSLDIKAFTRAVTIEQFTRDLLLCGSGKPSDPPSVDDAKRLLACRFNLPFEPTRLSPLVTEVDDDFFGRLDANPNVPRWLKRGADGKGGLAAYYARRAK